MPLIPGNSGDAWEPKQRFSNFRSSLALIATAREERRGGGKETATAVLSDSETILLSLSFRSAVCSAEVEEGGKLMKPTDVSGEALVFDAKRG